MTRDEKTNQRILQPFLDQRWQGAIVYVFHRQEFGISVVLDRWLGVIVTTAGT